MKIRAIIPAPQDLWAVFAEQHEGGDGITRFGPTVEDVIPVVALALLDVGDEDENEIVGVLPGMALWLAEEQRRHAGYVMARDRDAAIALGRRYAVLMSGEPDPGW